MLINRVERSGNPMEEKFEKKGKIQRKGKRSGTARERLPLMKTSTISGLLEENVEGNGIQDEKVGVKKKDGEKATVFPTPRGGMWDLRKDNKEKGGSKGFMSVLHVVKKKERVDKKKKKREAEREGVGGGWVVVFSRRSEDERGD